MICAATGEACFCNGRFSRVSSAQTLEGGILSFTDAASFEEHSSEDALRRLRRTAGGSRGWSAAYGHALVATGRVELMLDPATNPWNCAPFPPILREAGGYFGDWSGNEIIYAGEALSTTRELLPQVLRLIQSIDEGAGSLPHPKADT
jgi:histidinol-phosphatase